MSAGRVPTANLTALYDNTTPGTTADPAALDNAVADVVQTINDNYDFVTGLISAGTLSRLGVVNVKDYGASGSANTYTGSINAGSRTLTLTTGSHDFVPGRGISIPGAGVAGATLVTTVSSVQGSSGNITIADAASTIASSVTVSHDESLAIQNAVSAIYEANAMGGILFFPEGQYFVSTPVNPLNNVSSTFNMSPKIHMIGSGRESSVLVSVNGDSIFKPTATSLQTYFNIKVSNLGFYGQNRTGRPFNIRRDKCRPLYLVFEGCSFQNFEYGWIYNRFDIDGLSLDINGRTEFNDCIFQENKYGLQAGGDNTLLIQCWIRNNTHRGYIIQSGVAMKMIGGKIEYNGRLETVDADIAQLMIAGGTADVSFDGVYFEPSQSTTPSAVDQKLVSIYNDPQGPTTAVRGLSFRDCYFNGLDIKRVVHVTTGSSVSGFHLSGNRIKTFKLDVALTLFTNDGTITNMYFDGTNDVTEIKNSSGTNIFNWTVAANLQYDNLLQRQNMVVSRVNQTTGIINVIAGAVNSGASQKYFGGDAYTVVNEATGTYLVTLAATNQNTTSGNATYFPVTVTPESPGAAITASVLHVSSNSFRVFIRDAPGNLVNSIFSFVAVITHR